MLKWGVIINLYEISIFPLLFMNESLLIAFEYLNAQVPGQHSEHEDKPYCNNPCYSALFGPGGNICMFKRLKPEISDDANSYNVKIETFIPISMK